MLCLGAARSNLDFGDPTLNRSGRRPRGSGGGTAWQFIPLALVFSLGIGTIASHMTAKRQIRKIELQH